MRRILIIGNSSSGKSTLARRLSDEQRLAHLDLDTLAWRSDEPLQRKPLPESALEIRRFITTNPGWVIEGCYGDLAELTLDAANELVFLNLPVEVCIGNARKRPWEPHKYPTKEAQDANLETLINWIADYELRDDTMSKAFHMALYNRFAGRKTMLTANAD